MGSHDKGAITFGCLFMTAVLAVAGWHGWVFGEKYYYRWALEEKLYETAEFVFHQSDDAVKKSVIATAADFKVTLLPESITVTQTQGEMRIVATYDVPVKTPIIERTLHFRVEANRAFSR